MKKVFFLFLLCPLLLFAVESKKILVLGGTRFVGKHIVEQGLDKGYEITLFNRGRSNPNLFPETEKRIGDRKADLSALREGEWDVVIDISGYHPDEVKSTARLLNDRVKHYIYISSISVYDDFETEGLHEGSPLAQLKPGQTLNPSHPDTYGTCKAYCEDVLKTTFGGKILIIRPCIIVGPDDYTNRFSQWVKRFTENRQVAAPADFTTPVQWIDVRDLAAWVWVCVDDQLEGTYNAVGPKEPAAFSTVVQQCEKLFPGQVVWVNPNQQASFPMYKQDMLGFYRINGSRAWEKGLNPRSLSDTLQAIEKDLHQ